MERTPSLIYKKEPGYVYDLINVYIHYFNRDIMLRTPGVDSDTEIEAFYREVDETFSEIPEELAFFFNFKADQKSFVTRYYYSSDQEIWSDGYCLETLLSHFSDLALLRKNILCFYFPFLLEEDVLSILDKPDKLHQTISQSHYDTKIKNQLIQFYENPAHYAGLLTADLREKETVLALYYERHHLLLEQAIKRFDANRFIELIERYTQAKCHYGRYHTFFYTICIINKQLVCSGTLNDSVCFSVGYQWEDALLYLVEEPLYVDLSRCQEILSEPVCMKIVQILFEKSPVTTKYLSNQLKTPKPIIRYCLRLMRSCNMLLSQSRGRYGAYSINPKYFSAINMDNEFICHYSHM